MTSEHARVTLEAEPDRLDRLRAELDRLGTLGWEEREAEGGKACWIAYFPGDVAANLRAIDWAELGAERFEVAIEEPRDWMERYRDETAPFALGERFLVDPGEPGGESSGAESPQGGRLLLRLPAREAFGTGSHESTRLAVELLERTPLEGARVLDVGVGTGVLSFAAQALGARRVVGYDVDPVAAVAVRENGALNGVRVPAWCGGIESIAPRAAFDLVIANVRPERIGNAYPLLVALLAAEGRLLLSGFLGSELGVVESIAHGGLLDVEARRDAGEWAAWMLRRRS